VHEVSLVAELVDACLHEAAGAEVRRIAIRHASTASEAAIRQAFSMLTADGPLARAQLTTEQFPVSIVCSCGFEGRVGPDDEAGPGVAICPACSTVHRLPRRAEIELLSVETVF
jgi:Zn finger protein HypA/HybF involved in hydrogenase expression